MPPQQLPMSQEAFSGAGTQVLSGPQVRQSSASHVPQVSVPPQLFGIDPQVAPSAAQVVGVQPQTPGVPPPPQVSSPAQASPHAAQLLLVPSGVSQPLAAAASQSPQPSSQVKVQTPALQAGAVTWERVAQSVLQPPQWCMSLCVSTQAPRQQTSHSAQKPSFSQVVHAGQEPASQMQAPLAWQT